MNDAEDAKRTKPFGIKVRFSLGSSAPSEVNKKILFLKLLQLLQETKRK